MSMLTIGSLFSGYGGLDLAVERVFGATTTWVADIDPAATKVLAHRFPHAPNLGDVSGIDWASVPRVDIIAGGSPCQDLSTAGRRAGMTDGTRSNLWVAMREAIAQLRPAYVCWENVRGALSATATSAMESDPGLLGGHPAGQPVLRALGRVLGDLAELGYDASWATVRASDVGACHQRARVFLLAHARGVGGHQAVEHDGSGTQAGDRAGVPHQRDRDALRPGPVGGLTLLPSPVAQPSGNSPEAHLRKKPGREVVTDLAILVENGLLGTGGRLRPSPRTSGTNGAGRHGDGGLDLRTAVTMLPHHDRWGQYTAAIARHEHALGRPAPEPTIPGARGGRKLSGRFTEFMMMLPDGWIWDLVEAGEISNNDALKLSGNGVVPLQAEYAYRRLLALVPGMRVAA